MSARTTSSRWMGALSALELTVSFTTARSPSSTTATSRGGTVRLHLEWDFGTYSRGPPGDYGTSSTTGADSQSRLQRRRLLHQARLRSLLRQRRLQQVTSRLRAVLRQLRARLRQQFGSLQALRGPLIRPRLLRHLRHLSRDYRRTSSRACPSQATTTGARADGSSLRSSTTRAARQR